MAAARQIHPVILAGGSGVRLWPLSRDSFPKPFLPLTGERSFFQMTVSRVLDPGQFASPSVICAEQHRFVVAEQIQQLNVLMPRIVLEPVGRNTAPAACTAALLIAEQDPEDLLLLLPSDHFIADQAGFHLAVAEAAKAATEGWIVTFGARPDRSEIGYGYIERGELLEGCDNCFRVKRFVEKPDLTTARQYVAEGGFTWNSGMFLAPAGLLLEEFERFAPEIVSACKATLGKSEKDKDFLRLDQAGFAAQPSISIDYAVMEHTSRSAVVPIEIGWSDVGSWDALYRISEKDADGNVLKGPVLVVDSHDTYVHSQAVPIAALGLSGLAVVATEDMLLVCPRSRAQDISLLVDRLKRGSTGVPQSASAKSGCRIETPDGRMSRK